MIPEKTALSPEIVAILQAMARGLVHDDDGGHICVYCRSARLIKDIELFPELEHTAECPVTQARRALYSNGTPINIYKVTGQYQSPYQPIENQWYSYTGYTLALSKEEAEKQFQDFRNLTITFVRMYPEIH